MQAEIIHIPSEDEVAGDRSTVIGRFDYPARDRFRGDDGFDEAGWAEACADTETNAREIAAELLSGAGIDMTDAEIRLSSGEIRVYW